MQHAVEQAAGGFEKRLISCVCFPLAPFCCHPQQSAGVYLSLHSALGHVEHSGERFDGQEFSVHNAMPDIQGFGIQDSSGGR